MDDLLGDKGGCLFFCLVMASLLFVAILLSQPHHETIDGMDCIREGHGLTCDWSSKPK